MGESRLWRLSIRLFLLALVQLQVYMWLAARFATACRLDSPFNLRRCA